MKTKKRTDQPLSVINVDGALLKLSTLGQIAGRGRSTLERDARAGKLKVTRHGARCTRVRAEDAREYLRALSSGLSA